MIEPFDDRAVSVGTRLQVTVEAHHPDREPFTLAARDLPDGATFDPETGVLRWAPEQDDLGTHTVTFVADDGRAVAEESLTILVTDETVGPVLRDDNAHVARNSSVVIDVLGNDDFPDAPADWSTFQLLTEPQGRHQATVERTGSGYPTVRFTADRAANDSRFDYEVCDVDGRCASATVLVTVE